MKLRERKSAEVVSVHFELEASVYDDLEEYCTASKESKRKVIQTALDYWLKQRKLEERVKS